MNKEQILETKLEDLGLDNLRVTVIFRDWFKQANPENFARDRLGYVEGGREKYLPSLTVRKMIEGYGEWQVEPSKAFRRFAEKLLELGLKPTDWPLLAIHQTEIYQAHIERCFGDKEKLKQLPALTFGISPLVHYHLCTVRNAHAAEEADFPLWHLQQLEDPRVTKEPTVGDLLDVPFRDFEKDAWPNLLRVKRKFVSLGFTEDDGIFISDGTHAHAISTISKDLGVDVDFADKLFRYFSSYDFKLVE